MSCLREGLPSPDPPLMWGWYTWGCRLENLGRPVRAGFLRCIAPNDLWSSTCPFAYWPRAQISNHEGPVLGPFSYTNVPFKICFQIQRKKPWSALQLTLRCVDTWTFLSYISWHFLWRATCNVQKMKMWVAKRIPPQKETRQTWILPHTIKPWPQTHLPSSTPYRPTRSFSLLGGIQLDEPQFHNPRTLLQPSAVSRLSIGERSMFRAFHV
jgi:hypothetical protein